MQTRTLLVLLLAPACAAQVGGRTERDETPDAGMMPVDGSAPAGCTQVVTVPGDHTFSGDGSALSDTCWKLGGKLIITGSGTTSLAKLGDLRGVTDLEVASTGLVTLDFQNDVEVSGRVSIHDNAKLVGISRLAPASQLASIELSRNAVLATLGSLANVSRVTGALTISDSPALTSLGGFGAAMSSIGGNLTITNNAALSDVGELSRVQQVGGKVTISNNRNLDYCEPGEVGCCVDAASYSISNNASSQCYSESPPWCWDDYYGCPYGGSNY